MHHGEPASVSMESWGEQLPVSAIRSASRDICQRRTMGVWSTPPAVGPATLTRSRASNTSRDSGFETRARSTAASTFNSSMERAGGVAGGAAGGAEGGQMARSGGGADWHHAARAGSSSDAKQLRRTSWLARSVSIISDASSGLLFVPRSAATSQRDLRRAAGGRPTEGHGGRPTAGRPGRATSHWELRERQALQGRWTSVQMVNAGNGGGRAERREGGRWAWQRRRQPQREDDCSKYHVAPPRSL